MFDIGWSELVVIGVVALIAIGPKELPGVLRMVGQWMGKIRRMASEFQGQFQEAMREAEMADLNKHVSDINQAASNFTSSFDPVASVKKEFAAATESTSSSAATSEPVPPPEPAPALPPASAISEQPVTAPLDLNPAAEPTPAPSADLAEPVAPPKTEAGGAR